MTPMSIQPVFDNAMNYKEIKMNEKLILSIVEKFSEGSIGELDLNDGTYRLTMKREQSGSISAVAAPVAAVPAPVAESVRAPSAAPVASGEASAPAPVVSGGGEAITSPIVATYYASAGPDSPPFVRVGSKVKAGDHLCVLESMKMMQPLKAEFDCEIIAIHAASGDLVEYGQNLFTVKRL